MKKLIRLLSALSIVAAITGCQSNGVISPAPTFSNAGLTFERKELVLHNVPLPPDFVLMRGSFCHGIPTFRYGEFQFKGMLSVDDLFYYYQRQMPVSDWVKVSGEQFDTTGRMKFENEYEYCTLLFREAGSVIEAKIIIEQKKV